MQIKLLLIASLIGLALADRPSYAGSAGKQQGQANFAPSNQGGAGQNVNQIPNQAHNQRPGGSGQGSQYPQGGSQYPQGGHQQGGFQQGGHHNQGGFPQQNHHQGGFNQHPGGFNQHPGLGGGSGQPGLGGFQQPGFGR